MTKEPELFEQRYPCEGQQQALTQGYLAGLQKAVTVIEDLDLQAQFPGIALSISTIKAELEAERARYMHSNLIFLMKQGATFDSAHQIIYDTDSNEMVIKLNSQ